MGYMATF